VSTRQLPRFFGIGKLHVQDQKYDFPRYRENDTIDVLHLQVVGVVRHGGSTVLFPKNIKKLKMFEMFEKIKIKHKHIYH